MSNFQYYVDLDNFEKGMQGFDRHMLKMANALDDAFDEIAETLYLKLLENMQIHGVYSRLGGDAYVEKYPNGFEIGVRNEIAYFLEFGTGIVGQSSPHPKPSMGDWAYDINSHGWKGWVYPTGDATEPFKRTRGQVAKPYMYDTWLYGTRIVHPKVTKHLRRALK